MRIAFIVVGNARRGNYMNGYNLRYGNGGGSGTDTSCILVAEHMAKMGHEVVFVTDKMEPHLIEEYNKKGNVYVPGEEYYGVKYTNLQFDGIENREFEVLISMLWFKEYEELPIKVTKSLIYWSHMQWIYSIGETSEYCKKHNLSLKVVHISEWEKEMNKNVVNTLKNMVPGTKTYTIPNPIMDEMVNEVLNSKPVKKPHKFVFHASWARGGNVAIDAVRQLDMPDKEMHGFDYLMTIPDFTDSFFTRHNSADKKTLFRHIAESEYFVYPLYTPYQDVHKDTFSCVVAEAIALGAIVITYPLGALPENFDGYCAWLDFPDGVEQSVLQSQPLSKDIEGKFTITSNIVEKINFLENNKELKEQIRANGAKYILKNFNSTKVGTMWDNILNEIEAEKPAVVESNKLFDFIDGAFYINLDHRVDKKEYMENHFKELGILPFVKRKRAYSPLDLGYTPNEDGRFEHITYSLGNKTTHLDLIKLAKEQNYKNILLFEDDAWFYDCDEYKAVDVIKKALKQLEKRPDWELLYFGIDSGDAAFDLVDDNLVAVKDGVCTHAILINSTIFDRLIAAEQHITHMDIHLTTTYKNKYLVHPMAVIQREGLTNDIGGFNHPVMALNYWKSRYDKPINDLRVNR